MASGIKAVTVTLAMIVAAQAAAGDKARLSGKYSKKIDRDVVKVSIHPIGADDGRDRRVQVFFTYEGPEGEKIDFDGVGRIKGNQVTLYNRAYRLIATITNGTADLALEQSCGNHRLYQGYGYYTEHCDPEAAKLAPLAKGLRKESQ